MDKRFYVYEWFNKDTDEVFYVGKGTRNRYREINNRNKYFKNYHNKYNCDVRKVRTELEENEAFDIEKALIQEYRKLKQCKCNLTDGGEGCTFPEDTWNHWFRKLQYLHDIKGAMDDMPNEEDYSPKNLKNKSLDELKEMYDEFRNYRDGVSTIKRLGLENKVDLYEVKITGREIKMLTDMFANSVAKDNDDFKEYLNYKEEIDFIASDIDWNIFLNKLLENRDYYIELAQAIFKTLRFIKDHSAHLYIKIKSHKVESNFINIRFTTEDHRKTMCSKIDIYNIILSILMYKDKDLFQIINEEIFTSPLL